MLKIVTDDADRDRLAGILDELVTEGARRMVVRNCRAKERTLVTAAGGLKIEAPRVHDRREGRRFSS